MMNPSGKAAVTLAVAISLLPTMMDAAVEAAFLAPEQSSVESVREPSAAALLYHPLPLLSIFLLFRTKFLVC